MAILTLKEFAAMAGTTTGNISNYRTRGKVVATAAGAFDTEDAKNALFLKKRAAKGQDGAAKARLSAKSAPKQAKSAQKAAKTDPKPTGKVIEPAVLAALVESPRNFGDDSDWGDEEEEAPAPRKSAQRPPKEAGENGKPDFQKMIVDSQRLKNEKLEKEVEKLNLMNAKTRGETIPSALIQPLFLQHNQSIMTEFKNAGDDLLRRLCKKHGIPTSELAGMRGELADSVNGAMRKATALSVKAVGGIISQHIDRRGVGERL